MIDPSKILGVPRLLTAAEVQRLTLITAADLRAIVERWDRTAGVLPGLLRQLLDASRREGV